MLAHSAVRENATQALENTLKLATGSTNDQMLLKRLQLARTINVSARTVDNWQKRKIIPHLKVGKSVRFDLQRVLAALRRFEIKEVR